jgi:hypothetical protein
MLPNATFHAHHLAPEDVLGTYLGKDWDKSPRNTESSIILFDFLPTQDFFNALFAQSPTISLAGKSFGGNHVAEPNREDAVKKAEKIIEEMTKKDPLYKFQYHKINLKIEKVGTTQWWYGELAIKKMPFTKTVNLIKMGDGVLPSSHLSFSML